MGTRGYFALRYKGHYYIIYNNYDSYFEGLGYSLIRSIKELTKEQWDEIKKKLANANKLEKDTNDSDEEDAFIPGKEKENIILRVMNSYRGSTISRQEPPLDNMIEYVYIIDLDVDVFTAISMRHKDEDAEDGERRYSCRFENLSKEWLDSCDSW